MESQSSYSSKCLNYVANYMEAIEQKLFASVPTGNELIVLRAQYAYAMHMMDVINDKGDYFNPNTDMDQVLHPLTKFHINEPTSIVSDDYMNIGFFRAYHNIFNKLAKFFEKKDNYVD